MIYYPNSGLSREILMLIPKPFFKTLCLLSAWIAVFHLASQGFAPGTVLCLQADGRMSVEIPGADKSCAGLPSPHHNSRLVLGLAGAHPDECCGPCADLLLPAESVSECPAGRFLASVHLPLLTWKKPAAGWGALLRTPLSSCSLHPPPSASLPAAHLRHTTVLLI